MKRIGRWLTGAGLALALVACTGPNPVWLVGVKGEVAAITPEYLEYVAADEELSSLEKEIRQRSVARLNQLLEEVSQ